MPVLNAGKLAPPFELTGLSGAKYSLQNGLARKPVVAAFFKVSCPTCQYTFPYLERLYQQFHQQGGQVWGIVQDEAPAALRFANEYGITFPILIDDYPYEISREYGLEYVPSIFLIEPDGQVALSSEGFCKADLLEIQRSLAQSLAASPGPLFLPKDRVPEYKPG
jgi:peroxiredoxin